MRILDMFQARRAWVLLLAVTLAHLPTIAFADDKFSHVEFIVVRGYNGKPVRNASVVLHPVNKDGKQSKNGTELKTDPDGKASLNYVPYGKMRIQAIAPGLQTYGDDIEISQPEHQITIKMNRPQEQYSIYK
ncbi:MAG TPA: carboxypeptidase-like regulatory domain-containing protein [Terriglobales bacterium]|nr:carboxypeptidase-like regulatory domain-containing protein [Terriglobales bacterium]